MVFTRIWNITWTCTHPSPHLTNPLRLRNLHFPPLEEADTEVCRHTTHATVQIDNVYEPHIHAHTIVTCSFDHHMYVYPPAPTPAPSLESAEAPLSYLGKDPRQGRPAHNSAGWISGVNFYPNQSISRVIFTPTGISNFHKNDPKRVSRYENFTQKSGSKWK